MSTLLSRHLGFDADVTTDRCTLDLAELAAMDEYKAIAVFLRELRRHRKENLGSVKLKLDDRDDRFPRISQGSTGNQRYKDLQIAIDDFARKDAPSRKGYNPATPRRSLSADDSHVLRLRLRQENDVSRHGSAHNDWYSNTASAQGDKNFTRLRFGGPFTEGYSTRRSQSDILTASGNGVHTGVIEEGSKLKRRVNRLKPLGLAGDLPSLYAPPKDLSVGSSGAGHDDVDLNSTAAAWTAGKASVAAFCGDDDEDVGADPLRILTSIEPMDPSVTITESVTGSDARRGTSYHTGAELSRTQRRKGYRSGMASHDSSFLRRLRSFRRKVNEI